MRAKRKELATRNKIYFLNKNLPASIFYKYLSYILQEKYPIFFESDKLGKLIIHYLVDFLKYFFKSVDGIRFSVFWTWKHNFCVCRNLEYIDSCNCTVLMAWETKCLKMEFCIVFYNYAQVCLIAGNSI